MKQFYQLLIGNKFKSFQKIPTKINIKKNEATSDGRLIDREARL